jgi:hypothetical protein
LLSCPVALLGATDDDLDDGSYAGTVAWLREPGRALTVVLQSAGAVWCETGERPRSWEYPATETGIDRLAGRLGLVEAERVLVVRSVRRGTTLGFAAAGRRRPDKPIVLPGRLPHRILERVYAPPSREWTAGELVDELGEQRRRDPVRVNLHRMCEQGVLMQTGPARFGPVPSWSSCLPHVYLGRRGTRLVLTGQ